MRKETDMDGLKSLAHTLLLFEPVPTEYSPMIVKHPFTDSSIVLLKDGNGEVPQFADITEDKAAFKTWQEEMKKQIDALSSPGQFLLMLTKSYYLGFLKYAEPYLSQQDFSEFLATAWIINEAPNADPNFSQRKLLGLFKKAEPESLMAEDEYQRLQDLEETVTIYRGVTSHNAGRVKVLSWTLDKQTAEWFAHRFGEDGTVYEAEIDKAHIYALFNGRNESEVIIDPKYLMNLSEVQDMDEGFTMTQ